MEANLDIETILGLPYPIPVTACDVGGRAPFQSSQFSTNNRNEPYLEWLQFMLAQTKLPQVITISYADEEQTVVLWYAKRYVTGLLRHFLKLF
jgi:tripeptidyl-peptidase-1